MDCKRCGNCCLKGPCIIDRKLKDIIADKFPFVRDTVCRFKWRPPFTNKGVCKYLKKNSDNTYSCPVIGEYEEFRKHMGSGICALERFLIIPMIA